MKISLGCGKDKREGFIGLDHVDFGWNKVWDATKDALPFADGSVDFIEAHNFVEHIERKYWVQMFNECWRVLKPNGVFEIIVPSAKRSMDLALADPTHLSFWSDGSLKYFTGERPRNADYGIKPWIVKINKPYEKEERVDFIHLTPNK